MTQAMVARRMLDRHPTRSRTLLLRHKTLYPDGILSQERDVMLIEANRGLGRDEEAREAADRFLETHLDSAHGTKVRETLEREE